MNDCIIPKQKTSAPQVTGTVAIAAGKSSEPRVELAREGDRITKIRVTCRCGETIELECDYEA